jgi:hypothetical protein
MATGITLSDAQAHLANAQAAYDKALAMQEYSVQGALRGGARNVRYADLDALAAEVERWHRWVVRLSRGGSRIRRGVPL